jgi:hypothetical protein
MPATQSGAASKSLARRPHHSQRPQQEYSHSHCKMCPIQSAPRKASLCIFQPDITPHSCPGTDIELHPQDVPIESRQCKIRGADVRYRLFETTSSPGNDWPKVLEPQLVGLCVGDIFTCKGDGHDVIWFRGEGQWRSGFEGAAHPQMPDYCLHSTSGIPRWVTQKSFRTARYRRTSSSLSGDGF